MSLHANQFDLGASVQHFKKTRPRRCGLQAMVATVQHTLQSYDSCTCPRVRDIYSVLKKLEPLMTFHDHSAAVCADANTAALEVLKLLQDFGGLNNCKQTRMRLHIPSSSKRIYDRDGDHCITILTMFVFLTRKPGPDSFRVGKTMVH
jgi:hypothetical protein